jgi:hypothetical protein
LEQPDVLDGDNRLIGEGFEELDLHWSERAQLHATCTEYANQLFMLAKWSA